MSDSYIILNVGGICYTTSLLTLTSFSESMLGKMFGEGGVPPQPDKNGHYFIDRDGKMFRYILNFIRDKRLCLPSSFEEYDQLLAEADFYQLSDLKEEISRLTLQPVPMDDKDPAEMDVETVILRKSRNVYIVEANKQVWSKLKYVTSLQPDTSLTSRAMGQPRIIKGNEVKAYGDISYQTIFVSIIKDGFKLEASVLNNDCLVFTPRLV